MFHNKSNPRLLINTCLVNMSTKMRQQSSSNDGGDVNFLYTPGSFFRYLTLIHADRKLALLFLMYIVSNAILYGEF